MASKRALLAAWTATEGYVNYPKYINVTVVNDGEDSGIEFTVRSPEDLGSTTSVCRLPVGKDVKQFLKDLGDGLCKVAEGKLP